MNWVIGFMKNYFSFLFTETSWFQLKTSEITFHLVTEKHNFKTQRRPDWCVKGEQTGAPAHTHTVRVHCFVSATVCVCGSVLPAPVCGPLRGELGCRCSSGCWHAGPSFSGSRGSWWWRCDCSSRSDGDTYCTPYGPVKKKKNTIGIVGRF